MTPATPTTKPRRLIVLGSTGSIGVNTLDVVAHLGNGSAGDGSYDWRNRGRIEVVGLAAGRNADLLIEQARRFSVRAVAVADEQAAAKVRAALPDVQVHTGEQSALDLVQSVEADELMSAVVGSAGLPATLWAAEKGMLIGLANKETLVAAGELITPALRRSGGRLLPVDSEHSAIFQCLDGQPRSSVRRIVLTASGGPFRATPREQMENATVEQALKHPTWKMGAKITIDSATMMNKALEIIEAHWLFDLPGDRIDVIIHPQSIAHSFVEFEDNSVLAQLGPPDMRTPIQYALTYPDRPAGCSRAMDWSTLGTLTFEPPDHTRFRSLSLAYDVIEAGGTAGAVFNAANEAAVAAFLGGKIRFGRITDLVAEALSAIRPQPVDCLDTVMAADREARNYVDRVIAAGG